MKSSDIKTIEGIRYKRDVLDIRWRVTTLCNYQCDFCIQGNREEHLKQAEGESSELRLRICDAIVRLVESTGNQYRLVKVGLIGGEVTILKEFPDILERLAGCRYPGEMRISITTNFSADMAYLQNMLSRFRAGAAGKKRVFSISASFYSEYVAAEQFSKKLRELSACAGKERNTFRRILYKLGLEKDSCLLLAAGIPIVNDRDYEEYVRFKDAFHDTDIRIFPIIIRNYDTSLSEKNLKGIIEREKKKLAVTDIHGSKSYYPTIQALGAVLEQTDSFCPTGYLCEAGMRNIWIDAFGNVKRCPALGSTMSMGSILDGTFRMLEKPRICTSDHCSCGVYGKIEKVE